MKQKNPKKPAGRKSTSKPSRRKQSKPSSNTEPVIAKPADSDAILASNETNHEFSSSGSNQTNQTNQKDQTNQNTLSPYNETLLDSAKAQWQDGNWEGLARMERGGLQGHPDRAKLALLAAAGHLQQGNTASARQFTRLALEWGCGKKLVSQVLIAGVHNTLGRASAAAGQKPRALKHFEAAVAAGAPGSPSTLQTQARIAREIELMGLPGTAGLHLAWPNAAKIQEGEKIPASNSVPRMVPALDSILVDKRIWSSENAVDVIEKFIATHRNLKGLRHYLPSLSDSTIQNIFVDCLKIANRDSLYHAIIDNIADEKKMRFSDGAIIEFYDNWGLWTCIDELFLHQEYLFESASEQPVIIDCGSNIGLSVYYFKRLYPNAKITAFEPVPQFLEILKRNVQSNNWENVEVLPYALDGTDGAAMFHVPVKMSLAGTLTGRRAAAGDELESITVETRKLSYYLKTPVDYLKLDIEGSEDAVLEEAAPLLGNVEHIFCEYHHGLGMPTDRLKCILDVLDNAGFDYHISKSVNYAKMTSYQPMKHVGKPYSVLIFAKSKDWLAGQNAAMKHLEKN